jgi:thymidylate synthase
MQERVYEMRILAIISGEYGERHVANIQAQGPQTWQIEVWRAPAIFPPVIDYPEDYLPEHLPQSDLIVSFAEQRGVAELLPDMAQMTGAQAVLAPVDSEAWLPRGLARQLRGWLAQIHVACATPKPLCSLTETDFLVTRRQRMSYESPLISEFARYFGQPRFKIYVDPQTRMIDDIIVHRDTVCGCARHVAQGLLGVSVDEAEEQAGLLHHHFPCLASMGIDIDFDDTLMHVSGNLLKDAVGEQIKPHMNITYITPGNRNQSTESKSQDPGDNVE